MEIGTGMTGEGAFPGSGGTKRVYDAAQVGLGHTSVTNLPGSQHLESCPAAVRQGKQAGAEAFQLFCSQNHFQGRQVDGAELSTVLLLELGA